MGFGMLLLSRSIALKATLGFTGKFHFISGRLSLVQYQRQYYHNKLWSSRHLSKMPSCRSVTVRTVAVLSFTSPFAFLRHKPHTLSSEVMSHIPKEVFQKESQRAKKSSHGWLVRMLISLWKMVRYWLRFVRLWLTFTPVICLYPITYLGAGMQRRWWSLLLFACEFSGPTFIKLGQWASTRRDLFSAEFCDMFARLHYCTKIHSWYTTKLKLRKAFGKRWGEIFVFVEKKPIGSGCIAQVHKAWMKADMVPDESIVEEILTEYDEDDPATEIDFAEGLEITGLGLALDAKEALQDKIKGNIDHPEQYRVNADLTASNAATPTLDVNGEDSCKKAGADSLLSHTVTETRETANGDKLIPVAIKVVHPGVFKQVKRDLDIIECVSRFIEFCVPSVRWLSVSESCHEFTNLLMGQIDLRYEAKCLESFNKNFAEDPNVRFPRPIRPYCKRDVLVETFEEGERISSYLQENVAAPPGLKELLANYGVQAILQMVFVDNFVHGDLHPGNILVQNAHHFTPQDENKLVLVDICDTVVVNVKPVENPVRLVLLDAGITSSLSPNDLHNLKSVFTAVVIGEGETVADLMLKHARYNECKDIQKFKEELGNLVTTAREQRVTLGKVHVAELLSGVFSIMSRHKVKLESNFASILLAIFVLEGIGRSLDPDLDILTKAKPILLSP